jgi:hypothetical protein
MMTVFTAGSVTSRADDSTLNPAAPATLVSSGYDFSQNKTPVELRHGVSNVFEFRHLRHLCRDMSGRNLMVRRMLQDGRRLDALILRRCGEAKADGRLSRRQHDTM